MRISKCSQCAKGEQGPVKAESLPKPRITWHCSC